MNKKLVLMSFAVLVVFVVSACTGRPSSTTVTSAGTPNPSAAPAENFVKCKIDSETVEFKMIGVTHYSSMKSTTFMANEIGGKPNVQARVMQFSFPGKEPGVFRNTADSSDPALHYGVSVTESYENFFENGVSEVTVTEYSGDKIKGSFKGDVIFFNMNGRDPKRKHSLDCTFSSDLKINQAN